MKSWKFELEIGLWIGGDLRIFCDSHFFFIYSKLNRTYNIEAHTQVLFLKTFFHYFLSFWLIITVVQVKVYDDRSFCVQLEKRAGGRSLVTRDFAPLIIPCFARNPSVRGLSNTMLWFCFYFNFSTLNFIWSNYLILFIDSKSVENCIFWSSD